MIDPRTAVALAFDDDPEPTPEKLVQREAAVALLREIAEREAQRLERLAEANATRARAAGELKKAQLIKAQRLLAEYPPSIPRSVVVPLIACRMGLSERRVSNLLNKNLMQGPSAPADPPLRDEDSMRG